MRTKSAGLTAALAAGLITALAVPAAHARDPLGNKWRVTAVDITGVYGASIEEDTQAMQIYTETFFEGRGQGKPFVLRLSDRRPKSSPRR